MVNGGPRRTSWRSGRCSSRTIDWRSWCRTTCRAGGSARSSGGRATACGFGWSTVGGVSTSTSRTTRSRKRTKAVMICNPNNPTGHVLTEDEMDEVVRAADRAGAWIVADEIYRGAELDTDDATPTFFGRYERVIVTSGLSKAFAMPGLRVGWAVAPPKMIARIWKRHDYTTSPRRPSATGSPPSRCSPRCARRSWRAPVRSSGPTTRGSEAWLETHRDIFTWERPHAGAIAYARYDLPIKSFDLAERFRTERSALLVPGDMFGLKKGLRFGFGYDIEHTLKACRSSTRCSPTSPSIAEPGRRLCLRPWCVDGDAMRVGTARPASLPRLPRRGMGRAVHDDLHLFEMLTLEGRRPASAGRRSSTSETGTGGRSPASTRRRWRAFHPRRSTGCCRIRRSCATG